MKSKTHIVVMEAGFRELIIQGDNATVMKTIMSSEINLSRLGHRLYGFDSTNLLF